MARTYQPKTNLSRLQYSPTVNPLMHPQEVRTKRRLVKSGRSEDLVNAATGEITGVAAIHQIEERDDAEFVKVFAAGVAGANAADITLMVEPSYTPERAAEVYKPLADYLSKSTGHKISLITPRNYHFFWRDMRQNNPVDLVFAEAHISDYRIKRFNADPIVRAAENTSYTLLASAFYIDWTNQESAGICLPGECGGVATITRYVTNFGETSVRGFELLHSAQALPRIEA